MNIKPDTIPADPAEGVADIDMDTAAAAASPLNAEQKAALQEALEDLAELNEYAAELDLPPPAPATKEAARVFLHAAAQKVPRCYAISPWEERTVVVYTQEKPGFRADIFFDDQGGASCLITRPENKKCEQRHYPKADQVANEWVFDALRNLEK